MSEPLFQHHNDLKDLVSRIAQTNGSFDISVPGLRIFRCDRQTAPQPCMYGLGLAIAVQGSKRVALGDEIFEYGPGQSLVTAVDLPVVTHITCASTDAPFMALYLQLDARMLTEIATNLDFSDEPAESCRRAMHVVPLESGLLRSMKRLMDLKEEPELVTRLAPLVTQEIVIRLFSGNHGPMLRHLVSVGSPSRQILRVMAALKQNFCERHSMEDLAAMAHMSPSTFRQHFRAVSGMSPLQYLKQLRLQEARHLMITGGLDAGSAALQVGYESASQFSREYSRLFGLPPQKDVKRLRDYA